MPHLLRNLSCALSLKTILSLSTEQTEFYQENERYKQILFKDYHLPHLYDMAFETSGKLEHNEV